MPRTEAIEIARKTVVEVASEDEDWMPGDERMVTVEATDDPARFYFSVPGGERGCVVVLDGKAEVYCHNELLNGSCAACGWKFGD
jgi:hypothetical protein